MTTATYTTGTVAAAELVAATETVVAVLGGVSVPDSGHRVLLSGQVNIWPGTGTTGLELRIRRGATADSPIVGVSGLEASQGIASTPRRYTIGVEDTIGPTTGQAYCLTVVQSEARGNGVATQSQLSATVG